MILENKLNINDAVKLAKIEEKLSKKRAKQLFEKNFLDSFKAGTFETLSYIHKFLFEEIYYFAGEIRKVNISKGNFRFAPISYLEVYIKNIEKMPQKSFEQIIEKYVEMNIAHPFREGNGRSMRIWLDHILKSELKQVIDWTNVAKNDYLLAMERSPIKDIEIKHLLKNALSNDIYNLKLYIKGVDSSYFYEGYNYYNMEDI